MWVGQRARRGIIALQIKSTDLGNTTLHLIALGSRSQVVIRKKFSRTQLLLTLANA
jgi:hypothetical protein